MSATVKGWARSTRTIRSIKSQLCHPLRSAGSRELDKTGSSITKKCDIFNFGVAFAEIIAGKNVTLMYETPQEFLDNNDFSQSLEDFFVSMFKPIPKKRSSALDLLTCSFFTPRGGRLIDKRFDRQVTIN